MSASRPVIRANTTVKSVVQEEKFKKKSTKLDNDQKYITDINGFKEHVLALIVGYMAITKLQVKMAKASPGVDLYLGALDYTKKGANKYRKWALDSPIALSKKDITELHKGYISVLRELTKFYSVAKKRQGGKIPEASSFTGMYGPSYVGPNIVRFFRENAADFGPVINIDDSGRYYDMGGNIVDALPNLVPTDNDFGFAIRTTVANMFFLYFRRNGLDAREGRQFQLNGRLMDAFDDTGSPPLFGYGVARQVMKKNKLKWVVDKYRVGATYEKIGLYNPVDANGASLTTIAYLEALNPKLLPRGKDENGEYLQVEVRFNPQDMNVFYLSSLISLNSVTVGDMEAFEPGLKKRAMSKKDELLNEYFLVQYASDYEGLRVKQRRNQEPKPKRVQSPGKGYIKMPKV